MHCLPWTLLNRWGLRTAAQYVEDFNPFCLAVHKTPGIIAALSTDFATYLDPEEIAVMKSAAGHPVALRRDRMVVWNHNRGSFWMEDDLRNLRANLQAKIENFRRTCRAEMPVFVVGNCQDRYPEEQLPFLPALQDAIRHMTGRERNHLIITNQRPMSPGKATYRIDSHTRFVYVPFPEKAYKWFNPRIVDSAAGIAYELDYVKSLFDCLRDWGLLGTPPLSARQGVAATGEGTTIAVMPGL